MGFKRKHSTEDSSLSIASFRAFSISDTEPPTLFSKGSYDGGRNVDFQTNPRSTAWDFASASRVKSGDWGNRTRKRVRDNKPDERAIHGVCCLESCIGETRPANATQRTH